jgi:hypothetical protein
MHKQFEDLLDEITEARCNAATSNDTQLEPHVARLEHIVRCFWRSSPKQHRGRSDSQTPAFSAVTRAFQRYGARRRRGGIGSPLEVGMRIASLAAAVVFFGGDIASARHDEPLGVADLQCANGLSLTPGMLLTLAPLEPGVRGGTQIATNGKLLHQRRRAARTLRRFMELDRLWMADSHPRQVWQGRRSRRSFRLERVAVSLSHSPGSWQGLVAVGLAPSPTLPRLQTR